MGKLIVMILLGGVLSACSSGPVRVHGADVSVDDTRIWSVTAVVAMAPLPAGQAKKGRC